MRRKRYASASVAASFFAEHFAFDEQRQRAQRAAFAQHRQTRAAQHLKRLNDKLDLANSADAQLDVSRQTTIGHDLLLDALFEHGHLLDDVLARVPRIYERLHHLEKFFAESRIARDGPRLDQRHPLPRFAPLGVVILAAFQRPHQWSRRAFGTQTQIDAKDCAFLARRADGADDFLGELREKQVMRESSA